MATYRVRLTGGRYSYSHSQGTRLDYGFNGGRNELTFTQPVVVQDLVGKATARMKVVVSDPGSTAGQHTLLDTVFTIGWNCETLAD